jgi:hypothetical protein
MLERTDSAALPPHGRAHLAYFQEYERFMASFFETHTLLERAQSSAREGRFAEAAAILRRAQPEEVIRAYVRAARQGEISRGELALVVSLNLRWLPYFVSLRQTAGLEPVRVRLGRVEREPLAQGAGTNTFHFDEQGRLWKVIEPAPGATEIQLAGVMGDRLAPGRYSINGGAAVEARGGSVAVPLRPALTEIVLTKEP